MWVSFTLLSPVRQPDVGAHTREDPEGLYEGDEDEEGPATSHPEVLDEGVEINGALLTIFFQHQVIDLIEVLGKL